MKQVLLILKINTHINLENAAWKTAIKLISYYIVLINNR